MDRPVDALSPRLRGALMAAIGVVLFAIWGGDVARAQGVEEGPAVGQEIAVARPLADQRATLETEPGAVYVLDFPGDAAEPHFEDPDLLLRFGDGGAVVFRGFGPVAQSEHPPVLRTEDADVSGDVLLWQLSQLLTGEPNLYRFDPEEFKLAPFPKLRGTRKGQ